MKKREKKTSIEFFFFPLFPPLLSSRILAPTPSTMASPAARKRVLKASSSNLMGRGAAAASVALLAAFVFATSAANAAAASKTSSSPSQPLLLSTPSGEPSSPLTLEIPGLVSGGLKTKPSTGGRVLAAKRSFASSWKRNGGGDGGAQLDTSSTSSTSTSSSSSSSSSSAAAAAAALPPCSALVTVSPAWTTLASGDPAVSLAVTVTNDGAAAVPTPWEVKLVSEGSSGPDSSSSPSYSSVLQAWNLEKTALVSASSNNGSSSQAISGQAPGYWQAIPPHGGQASFGMILELSKETGASLLNSLASSAAASETGSASASASSLLMGAPTSLELNGRACALETEVAEALEAPPALELPLEGVPAASNETTTTSTPAPTSTPPPANVSSAFSPGSGDASITPGRMTTLDGKIIGVDGKPVYLMGLNWFGFDAGATMTDGLWGGRDATAQDFANVVYRIKLLGFNAIRLPFSFRDLYEKTPKWLNTKCTYVPPEAVAAQTRPSTVSAAAAGNPPPPGDAFAVSTPQGTCNSYMPQQNTFDRFLWTVDYLARNGFYVMLDNQFNLDQTATQQPQLWVQRWTDLATKLTQRYPLAASMSMIDIINEPDAWGVGWTPQNGKPGYGDMSLKIMDALYKVNPGFLYVLEGCGQANLAKNWGDGMAVDPELVKSRGLTDPNPFFRTLMTRPYLSQVIAGPHVYSPSVSSAQDSTEGPALYKRLSQSFGYLNKQGYCLDGSNAVGKPSGNCHVFPVVIGETGTGFVDRRDLQPQLDLAAWAVAKPGSGVPADDGLHNPVQGFFWWAWNANGDGQMGKKDSFPPLFFPEVEGREFSSGKKKLKKLFFLSLFFFNPKTLRHRPERLDHGRLEQGPLPGVGGPQALVQEQRHRSSSASSSFASSSSAAADNDDAAAADEAADAPSHHQAAGTHHHAAADLACGSHDNPAPARGDQEGAQEPPRGSRERRQCRRQRGWHPRQRRLFLRRRDELLRGDAAPGPAADAARGCCWRRRSCCR